MVSRNRPHAWQGGNRGIPNQTEGNMEQTGQYELCDARLAEQAATLGNALWYIAESVILILAVLSFTYNLVAAEVALAQFEQITAAAAPR